MLIFSEIGKFEIVVGGSTESPAKAFEQLFPINYSENVLRMILNYSWIDGVEESIKDKLVLVVKVLKVNTNPSENDILIAEKKIFLKEFATNIRHNIDINLGSVENKAIYKFELWQYEVIPPKFIEPITNEIKAVVLSDFIIYSYSSSFPSDIFSLSILEEVKLQCGIEDNGEDSKILSYVKSAYGLIEKKLRTKLFESDIVEYIEAKGTYFIMASNYINNWEGTKLYKVYGIEEKEIDLTGATIQHGIIDTPSIQRGKMKLVYRSGFSIDNFPEDLKSAIVDEVIFLYKYRQQSAEIVSSRSNGQGQTTSYKIPLDMLTNFARHICEKYAFWGQ